MIVTVVFLALGLVSVFLLVRWTIREDTVAELPLLLIFAMFLLFLLWFVTTKASSGFYPGFSTGIREGYITKISNPGLLWKTNEAQLQMGTGQQAALQEPWEFSIPDPETLARANQCMGRLSRVEYTQWWIQPWRRGESGVEATSVTCPERFP